MLWQGRERSYLLVAPPDADPATALPLVIALHGAGQDAASFADETRFAEAPRCCTCWSSFPTVPAPKTVS
jgi:poly(3-hydroxybutyrate) depolymerase